jgi:hypothetical protein
MAIRPRRVPFSTFSLPGIIRTPGPAALPLVILIAATSNSGGEAGEPGRDCPDPMTVLARRKAISFMVADRVDLMADIVEQPEDDRSSESFPTPDEPEGAIGFQRQMSLKGGVTDAVDC